MPSTLRRDFLGILAAGAAVSITGCSSSCPDTDTPNPSHTVETTTRSKFETLPDGAWPSPRFNAANTGYTPVEPPSPTPSVRWQTTVPTESADQAVHAPGGPIVADETVVLTTPAGVFALSLRDGTKRWRHDLAPTTIEPTVGYGEELVAPVIADDKVFCPTVDGVVALAIEDGSIVWRADNVAGTGTPATTGDGVIVPTPDGLTMLDARDGSHRWMDPADARLPAVSDGTVVTGGEQTVALDAATGDRQWTAPGEGADYPVVADGTVYLGTGDGLIGRMLSDGSERWRVDRGRFLLPPVVTPEHIYAVERPGEAGDATFAFDRRGDSPPDPRWCSAVGEAAVTAASDDTLITLQSGGLVAFTADFGNAEWQYSPAERVQPPAVLDGCVVSAATDGTVVGIGGE